MIVRYWAAAKAAAGLAEEQVDATTLAGVLEQVRTRHDARLGEVLARCSFVLDGDPVGTRAHESVAVGPDSVVECLPPFAGG